MLKAFLAAAAAALNSDYAEARIPLQESRTQARCFPGTLHRALVLPWGQVWGLVHSSWARCLAKGDAVPLGGSRDINHEACPCSPDVPPLQCSDSTHGPRATLGSRFIP